MAGIRINHISDASKRLANWGFPLGKDFTRDFVRKRLPYPLRAASYFPGKVQDALEHIVDNSPEAAYMANPPATLDDDLALPLIRAAVEVLLEESGLKPEQFDALIVAGGPYRIVEPEPAVMIRAELDSHNVISERLMLGKRPGTKPWHIEVLPKGCVSWVKALRHVDDLMERGEISSALLVTFGLPTAFLDEHKLYEASNHRDNASACSITYAKDGPNQITFGEEQSLCGEESEALSKEKLAANRNGESKKHKVRHAYNPLGLSFIEKFSFSPEVCSDKLEESLNIAKRISTQIAKNVINILKNGQITLDEFDAILVPQVNEKFVDIIEILIGKSFRDKLKIPHHIREELKDVVRSYCPAFVYEDDDNGEKKKDEVCRNFLEVIKQNEFTQTNNELSQVFYSRLTNDEKILFQYMQTIHNKVYRTYDKVGYTAGNSIPGALVLGVKEGRFNLHSSKIIAATGDLGLSFDSLTMNTVTTIEQSSTETLIDLPVVQNGNGTGSSRFRWLVGKARSLIF